MTRVVNGNQVVADAVCQNGVQGVLLVEDTPIPIRVGLTNIVRKVVTAYNNSDSTVYWGWNADVTTTTGTPILGHTLMTWAVNQDKDVWLVGEAAAKIPGLPEGVNIRITEAI